MPRMLQLQNSKLPFVPEWRTVLAGAALFAAGILTRGLLVDSTKVGVLRSPRTTLLPHLTPVEQLDLPYPPDALPGARDIETPFGTFRAYEWGPEDGQKVLMIHGISTPCLSLGGVAHSLVQKGCRVMLFDLPGRGYSDTPTDIRHDVRFFISQILIVLASSPLSWSAATGGFALVGYSLGGGIAASFASYFPDLVTSLVMIAPAGVIRDRHISRTSRIIYSEGVLPEPLLHRLVRRRLQGPFYSPKKDENKQPDDEKTDASDAVQAEVNVEGNQRIVLSKSHPNITIEAAVQHQIINHAGFVQAFMSSIRYGPIRREHERWRTIGRRLTAKNQTSQIKDKILVVLGERDPIIVLNEIQEDAIELFEHNVEFKILSAGHEVPISKADDVANLIWDHLQETF